MIIKTNFLTISVISLIILFPAAVKSDEIPLPTYPVEPVYSDVKKEKPEQETKKETGIKMEVMVILGTSDEIRGTIFIPERIYFKHYKHGLLYEKTIEPDILQSITILEFSKSDASVSGAKKFYRFEPSVVEIKLSDGSVYRIDRIFNFLKSFNIETENGKTRLYTFFGDSFEKGKGWANVESKDPEYHKSKPHPASVRKIIFLKVNP